MSVRYTPITCPHCGQQTQFDFDAPSCYCMRCAQLIEQDAPASVSALVEAADRSFLHKSFSDAHELYTKAVMSAMVDPYVYVRKAICGVYLAQSPTAMAELIATYAQCDNQLQADPADMPKRQALAAELLYFLQSEALFLPRDSSQLPFPTMDAAREYCLRYCAVFELIRELYKYVPYDLLDEREALSRQTQLFCGLASRNVYYYRGQTRLAAAIAVATRNAAAQVWNECAHDLAYIQSLRGRY